MASLNDASTFAAVASVSASKHCHLSNSCTFRFPPLLTLPSQTSLRPLFPVRAATYRLKLITPSGVFEVDAPHDGYILEAGEAAGIDLPFSCRGGACSACAAKVLEGQLDQSEGSYLDDEQKQQGFALTCISYPRSDLVLQTHADGEL